MTIDALKATVMLQLGEDVDDVSDYDDLLNVYLERGYRMMADKYMSGDQSSIKPLLTENLLPEWTHSALADFATYRILMNGNAQKQARASAFYASFQDANSKLRSKSDEDALVAEYALSGVRKYSFTNLYTN